MSLCSIIVRSFNEEKHIGKLLDGIKKQRCNFDLEIIVVDSGSSDNTVSIAKRFGAKIISIKPDEFSFGRALNLGCDAAKGEFLLFASAHVYPVYTNWIEKMLQPFHDEKTALVYGRQIGNEVSKYSEQQLFNKWFPKESNYKQSTPFCNNANSVIRKSLWLSNPFNEVLTGLEDLDWAARIERLGYHIAYEADATIVHVHEEPISKIKNRYRREAIALKAIMPKQNFSFFEFLKLTIAHIVIDSIHAVREGVFLKYFLEIIQFRSMQFYGTYLGFRQKGSVDQKLRYRFYYPKRFGNDKTVEKEPGERIIYNLS